MHTLIEQQIKDMYLKYQKEKTYVHVQKVAKTAQKLADHYHLDREKCRLASLLHDISAIMSADQMYTLAMKKHLSIDPSEEKYHFLLHQKISRIIAEEYFHISDEDILSAIACHTTLKKDASDYDKVIFLADKLSWDQEGRPPYDDELNDAIDISLTYGCYWFIKYQFDHHKLLMPHQWIKEAYQQFKEEFEKI